MLKCKNASDKIIKSLLSCLLKLLCPATINYSIFGLVSFETFGAWGTEGLSFIKAIGQKIQHLTGNNFYLF